MNSMMINISQRIHVICASVLLLLLSGCSTGIYHEGGDEYGYWSLDGKLGIRSSSGAESVALLWQQCGSRYQIRLNSLIGTHIASIDGNATSVTAQFNDRPALQAESAEALIQSELGWTLPVGALQYWLRGEADPQLSQNIQRNTDGSLKQLTQDDWQIDYLRYHSADVAEKNTRQLPEKIRLKRADTTLTLIISNWRLGIAPEHCLDN
jgi:outer membrane lipoprotein LolB